MVQTGKRSWEIQKEHRVEFVELQDVTERKGFRGLKFHPGNQFWCIQQCFGRLPQDVKSAATRTGFGGIKF